jgi:hypothetical protein
MGNKFENALENKAESEKVEKPFFSSISLCRPPEIMQC